MISDTLIFIFGFVIFGAWIVGTILEFRKMAKKPKKIPKETVVWIQREIRFSRI